MPREATEGIIVWNSWDRRVSRQPAHLGEDQEEQARAIAIYTEQRWGKDQRKRLFMGQPEIPAGTGPDDG